MKVPFLLLALGLTQAFVPSDPVRATSRHNLSTATRRTRIAGVNGEFDDTIQKIRTNIMEGELGQRGEVYVAGQFGLLLCILWGTVPLVGQLVKFLCGPVLMIGGMAIIILSGRELGGALSPWPVVADTSSDLKTGGVYQYVRHPMYTGLLAACAGFSVWTGSAVRLLLTAALGLLLKKKSSIEEEFLKEKFPEYDSYKEAVPQGLIPDIKSVLRNDEKELPEA